MRLLRYAPSDSSTYIKYDSGVLGRKPCIHIRLHLLATNPCEKCGLMESAEGATHSYFTLVPPLRDSCLSTFIVPDLTVGPTSLPAFQASYFLPEPT